MSHLALHPTTLYCLEMLEWLQARHSFARVLDMGCGNGILSLAAATHWQANVLAADISPQAVADTKKLSSEYGTDGCISTIQSDGFHHPLIRIHAPYDLIICNLLAEPITQWAPQMQSHVADGSVCLLSGILAWLAAPVEETYRQHGFTIIHSVNRSPWMTYIMQSCQL